MSTCGLCLGILAQQPLVLYFCWCWRCPCIAVVLVLALHMCWHCTCIVFVIVPVLVLLLCIIVTNCLSFFDHFSAFDNWKRNDGRFVRAAAFHWYFISCLLLRCHADHNINIYPSLSLSLSLSLGNVSLVLIYMKKVIFGGNKCSENFCFFLFSSLSLKTRVPKISSNCLENTYERTRVKDVWNKCHKQNLE